MTQAAVTELMAIGDVELVEELSMLTTQTARMRARMVDIMAELDRRRNSARPADKAPAMSAAMSSHGAKSW